MIESFFYLCCSLIYYIGDVTSLGYYLTNIILFVVIQPFLILLFFTLWFRNKNKLYGK
jgi:hypothetical protein